MMATSLSGERRCEGQTPGQRSVASACRTEPINVEELNGSALDTWLANCNAEAMLHALTPRYVPILLNYMSLFRFTKTREEIEALAMECTRRSVADHRAIEAYIYSICPETPFLPHVRLGNAGHVESALKLRKGAIICAFRFGRYTHLPLALTDAGYTVWSPVETSMSTFIADAIKAVISRCKDSEWISEENRVRSAGCARWIVRDIAAVRTMPELACALMKRQDLVLIYAEGNSGTEGPWDESGRTPITFMGRRVSVKTGVGRLSWSTGAPIVPVVSDAEGNAIYGDTIVPEETRRVSDRERYVSFAMQQLYDFLGARVMKTPEAWLGVSSMHRWSSAGSDASQSRKGLLQPGVRYDIDRSRVIVCASKEGELWIDAETLATTVIPWQAATELKEVVKHSVIGVNIGCSGQSQRMGDLMMHLASRGLLVPITE